MGWDIERFPEGEVNLELICCICTCILEDPVESPCRHVFCSACIKTWLCNQKSCPHCRAPVHKKDLQSVVPLLKNIISKQKIFCDNRDGGCPEIISLEGLASHVAICPFGMVPCLNEGCIVKICRKDLKSHIEICSKRTVLCERGCEMLLKLGDRTTHNCVQALRSHFQEVTNEMQDRISKLEELVNVLVSKSCSNHNDMPPSSNGIEEPENYGPVPYSIPSPRTYDSGPPPYTVFADIPRINNVNLSGISAENNDFSDSVESVESENIEQSSEMGTRYNASVQRANELDNPTPRQQNFTLQESEIPPVFRHLNRVSDSFESRGRNERLWENDREQIRSRSAHNRRQMETAYSRNRSNNNRSRESRIERVNRSYTNYDRESRRVNPSVTGEQEEPLILRIGVSSQTVTDSSTSSGSSSDSENEE